MRRPESLEATRPADPSGPQPLQWGGPRRDLLGKEELGSLGPSSFVRGSCAGPGSAEQPGASGDVQRPG